jgi:CDP-6-deoxy-D-xylo-4-hexulose-3-dehydrase
MATEPAAQRRAILPGGWPMGSRELELVTEVVKSGVIFDGAFTRRFEEMVAAAHGRRLAIFVNSGTSALEMAVHALKRQRGWRDGDEVLVPAITFVATVNPVIRLGLKPVFVDVDPLHFDIDADQLERRLTPRTRAIMPVHVFGQPARMERVMEFARLHDLAVIEDSCETMFVHRHGKVVGSWGDVACFSTFQVHLISTGIGGLAATDDERLAVVMKSVANHGMDSYELRWQDGHPRWRTGARAWGYDDAGYSFRATDLEAALGIAQMERWPEIVGAYQRNAARLADSLADLQDHLQLPSVRDGSEHAWFRYGIVVKNPAISRDDLLEFVAGHRVFAWYLLPLLNQPVYQKLYGDLQPDYPVAANLNRNAFYLGCHVGLSLEDMDYLSEVVHSYFARA